MTTEQIEDLAAAANCGNIAIALPARAKIEAILVEGTAPAELLAWLRRLAEFWS